MSLYDAYVGINTLLSTIPNTVVNNEMGSVEDAKESRVIFTNFQGDTSVSLDSVSKMDLLQDFEITIYGLEDGADPSQQVLAELYESVLIVMVNDARSVDGIIQVLPKSSVMAFETDQENVGGATIVFTVKYRISLQ